MVLRRMQEEDCAVCFEPAARPPHGRRCPTCRPFTCEACIARIAYGHNNLVPDEVWEENGGAYSFPCATCRRPVSLTTLGRPALLKGRRFAPGDASAEEARGENIHEKKIRREPMGAAPTNPPGYSPGAAAASPDGSEKREAHVPRKPTKAKRLLYEPGMGGSFF